MKLQARCPHCSKRYLAPEQLAGKSVKCPGCGATVRIPTPAPPSPPNAMDPLAPLPTTSLDDLLAKELAGNPIRDVVAGDPALGLLAAPVPRRRSFLRRLSRRLPGMSVGLRWRGWIAVILVIAIVVLGGSIWLWPGSASQLVGLVAIPVVLANNFVLLPLFLVAVGRRWWQAARLTHQKEGVVRVGMLFFRLHASRFISANRRQLREPSLFWRIILYVGLAELLLFGLFLISFLVFLGVGGPDSIQHLLGLFRGGPAPVAAGPSPRLAPTPQGSAAPSGMRTPIGGDPLDRQFKQMTESVNQRLPRQMDAITRWDRVEAMPGKTLIYIYTLSRNLTNQEKQTVKESAKRVTRVAPGVRNDFGAGATLWYKYFDTSGNLVFEFSLKR